MQPSSQCTPSTGSDHARLGEVRQLRFTEAQLGIDLAVVLAEGRGEGALARLGVREAQGIAVEDDLSERRVRVALEHAAGQELGVREQLVWPLYAAQGTSTPCGPSAASASAVVRSRTQAATISLT